MPYTFTEEQWKRAIAGYVSYKLSLFKTKIKRTYDLNTNNINDLYSVFEDGIIEALDAIFGPKLAGVPDAALTPKEVENKILVSDFHTYLIAKLREDKIFSNLPQK